MFELRQLASLTLATGFVLSFAGASVAQTWSSEQQEVWKFEEQQWQMAKDKDLTWVDKLVHANLSYWETGQDVPQGKASLARWSRFESSTGAVLEQEIFPVSMTITGNIAVAQYHYRVAREDYKKERETSQGHYTDILIKDGGRWQFLAWAGGDNPKK